MLIGALRRQGLEGEDFLPGARADGDPVRDGVAEQIVDRGLGGGIDREISVLGIPHEETVALERASDALGDALHEGLQLRSVGPRATGSRNTRP